ncbi:MAG: metalloregulator ArsR/SmtB family transcription factor [Thermoanaerobaculia bacterium]|nr:metalloregulator ArsR/SmtB family transcription factor [Thermoanaerobaculia bacterium]
MLRATEAAPQAPENPARLFAALGDENRLRLVDQLCEGGPMSASRLTSGLSISRQAVTKHLLRLEGAGLVRSRRRGRERLWQIEPPRLDEAQRYLEMISAQWDTAIERLRGFVEG